MLVVGGTHENLGEIVSTHLKVESLTERRLTLIQVIAAGGGLIWLGLVDPPFLPRSVMTLAEIGVPLLLGTLAYSLCLELKARVRLSRLLRNRRQDPPPASGSPHRSSSL